MREAVIVSAVRTAVGKAGRGALRHTRPDDLAAAAIHEAICRVPGLKPEDVEDVVLGCAMPEAEQGMNVARIACQRAGLPCAVPAVTVNRLCASGLEAIAIAAQRILCGSISIAVAGGTESMSMVPLGGQKFAPNPALVDALPDAYLSMGLTGENLSRRYNISREAQDAFAFASHQKAIAAIDAGRFKQETLPLTVKTTEVDDEGRVQTRETVFQTDEGPRRDTSPEMLAQLKPVFHTSGAITAGNASQTSDGASALVLMSSDRAREMGLSPMARFVAYAVAGVPPEIMGIGPAAAVPKALRAAGLRLGDVGLIELNEAFAVQALSVVQELDLPPDLVNVNGGAVALGHPLGCTGARLTTSILHEMRRRSVRYGLVTMCVGGGMGGAGIFERMS
ncbi:MAG: acetyl-CoA acetyltransferase [Candidatus Handelsmanbacteria bacterium RIFCSPLOWO2_12_FULL_64_10]|uniref:acetyl-CoA C-acyltransferase n=1 Tax=Handelsmanbacteria sp. (strain RIFCSPLOWO2_12_FULL_64_10) TaxID=1817868 RepID=A0A1F6D455_HANXR|nr:MAG: acetyl-CoA acetyltransferase [Candidatus Handelsmanbacteria bacterium RIFCSPLOWO2_12_FULL_64_10]